MTGAREAGDRSRSSGRNDAGLTSSQLAAQQAAGGFKVWMDYDDLDGSGQYMEDLETANEDILDLRGGRYR